MLIPFDDDGQQAYRMDYRKGFREVDNFVFEATLTLADVERGRSSVAFKWTTNHPRVKLVSMFPSEMVRLVKSKRQIHLGRVTASWTFVKRGENYSVSLVEEDL